MTNTNESVVIFVLGYRAKSHFQAGSLEAIETAANRITKFSTHIVYLDNYSCDGSIEWLLENHPNFDVVMAPTNYMYCKGTNVGIQYCQKKYHPKHFILVDADNHAEPDAYEQLVEYAETNPNVGMVQPLVKSYKDKATLYSCGHQCLEDGQFRPICNLPANTRELENLHSCSISSTLLRAETLEKCGLLDPIYVIYYESSDLSFRVRQSGYKCACHIGAVTYNEGSSGEGINKFHLRYYVHRNRFIFWKIHDEQRFARVKHSHEQLFAELQEIYNASEFGIDAEREAIRKGIEDGLNIAENPSLLPRCPVGLNDFDKSAVVVISD